MATQTATFPFAAQAAVPSSTVWSGRIAERNMQCLARQQRRRRGPTPEVPFTKHLDNSRLVKASDPVRVREMRLFAIACCMAFFCIMIYGLQHFNAIESGYSVEAEKQQLDHLREENRQLKLMEAQLTQPGRIDTMSREMGMAEPQPGQVVRGGGAHVDTSSAPALAEITPAVAAIR